MVSAGPAVVRVGVNTISRRSHSVAGRLVQVWRRAGASQIGSRTISRRSHSVAGRLVQVWQRLASMAWRQQQQPASGTSVDARAVVSPQQLQEMMEQSAGRAVDEFSRRPSASSSATGPDSIVLDFAEGFVLYAPSVSGYSCAVS